ncbi:MAG: TatD family hydrolase [Microgenomates group bacterium]
MIDTHSHISPSEQITVDSLKFVILSGSNLEDSKNNVELAKSNPKLLAAVGIHPQEIITNYELTITNLDELLKNNKEIIAVGECGLDFSQNPSPLRVPPLDRGGYKDMEILFRRQIELAIKYDKPLIIHSRKAMEETLAILNSYTNLRGVIHCYTGGIKRIKNIPESFYLGIDGNLTYEGGLGEVVKNIPKDRLLLETDSPYLTPVPHRGEENRPEYVKYVYQKVAEIWGTSFEETEKIVDENAKRLFLPIS